MIVSTFSLQPSFTLCSLRLTWIPEKRQWSIVHLAERIHATDRFMHDPRFVKRFCLSPHDSKKTIESQDDTQFVDQFWEECIHCWFTTFKFASQTSAMGAKVGHWKFMMLNKTQICHWSNQRMKKIRTFLLLAFFGLPVVLDQDSSLTPPGVCLTGIHTVGWGWQNLHVGHTRWFLSLSMMLQWTRPTTSLTCKEERDEISETCSFLYCKCTYNMFVFCSSGILLSPLFLVLLRHSLMAPPCLRTSVFSERRCDSDESTVSRKMMLININMINSHLKHLAKSPGIFGIFFGWREDNKWPGSKSHALTSERSMMSVNRATSKLEECFGEPTRIWLWQDGWWKKRQRGGSVCYSYIE